MNDENNDKYPFIRAWRTRWPILWPNLRAIFVLFHIFTVLIIGFPAPAGVTDRSHWKDPSVQDEMRTAAKRARAIGFPWTDAEFEDLMYELATEYNQVRRMVLKPFRPYAKYCGVRQSWRMFSAPHRYPTIMQIEIEENKAWRPVYRIRSDEYDWMRTRFDHHRIRRLAFLHGWKKYRRSYNGFAKWVRREATRDFPNATRVRIKQLKVKSMSPDEVKAGVKHKGKWQNQRTYSIQRGAS